MAQITIRNLDDQVRNRLKARARRSGRSMEAEVRDILRDAVKEPATSQGLGTRISKRFKGIGLKEDIAEQRGFPAHPPSL
jgi:plasmid stability protein